MSCINKILNINTNDIVEDKYRYYLIIEPEPKTLEGLCGDMHANLQIAQSASNGLPPQQLIGKIINAYFNDALYNDIYEAYKMNVQLKALNDLIDKNNNLKDFRDEILSAVNLKDKQIVNLEHIPSQNRRQKRDRLACAFMMDFGGFFKKEYREQDFNTGRREAEDWLRKWLDRINSKIKLPVDESIVLSNNKYCNAEWNSLGLKDRIYITVLALLRLWKVVPKWLNILSIFDSLNKKLMNLVVLSILVIILLGLISVCISTLIMKSHLSNWLLAGSFLIFGIFLGIILADRFNRK